MAHKNSRYIREVSGQHIDRKDLKFSPTVKRTKFLLPLSPCKHAVWRDDRHTKRTNCEVCKRLDLGTESGINGLSTIDRIAELREMIEVCSQSMQETKSRTIQESCKLSIEHCYRRLRMLTGDPVNV